MRNTSPLWIVLAASLAVGCKQTTFKENRSQPSEHAAGPHSFDPADYSGRNIDLRTLDPVTTMPPGGIPARDWYIGLQHNDPIGYQAPAYGQFNCSRSYQVTVNGVTETHVRPGVPGTLTSLADSYQGVAFVKAAMQAAGKTFSETAAVAKLLVAGYPIEKVWVKPNGEADLVKTMAFGACTSMPLKEPNTEVYYSTVACAMCHDSAHWGDEAGTVMQTVDREPGLLSTFNPEAVRAEMNELFDAVRVTSQAAREASAANLSQAGLARLQMAAVAKDVAEMFNARRPSGTLTLEEQWDQARSRPAPSVSNIVPLVTLYAITTAATKNNLKDQNYTGNSSDEGYDVSQLTRSDLATKIPTSKVVDYLLDLADKAAAPATQKEPLTSLPVLFDRFAIGPTTLKGWVQSGVTNSIQRYNVFLGLFRYPYAELTNPHGIDATYRTLPGGRAEGDAEAAAIYLDLATGLYHPTTYRPTPASARFVGAYPRTFPGPYVGANGLPRQPTADDAVLARNLAIRPSLQVKKFLKQEFEAAFLLLDSPRPDRTHLPTLANGLDSMRRNCASCHGANLGTNIGGMPVQLPALVYVNGRRILALDEPNRSKLGVPVGYETGFIPAYYDDLRLTLGDDFNPFASNKLLGRMKQTYMNGMVGVGEQYHNYVQMTQSLSSFLYAPPYQVIAHESRYGMPGGFARLTWAQSAAFMTSSTPEAQKRAVGYGNYNYTPNAKFKANGEFNALTPAAAYAAGTPIDVTELRRQNNFLAIHRQVLQQIPPQEVNGIQIALNAIARRGVIAEGDSEYGCTSSLGGLYPTYEPTYQVKPFKTLLGPRGNTDGVQPVVCNGSGDGANGGMGGADGGAGDGGAGAGGGAGDGGAGAGGGAGDGGGAGAGGGAGDGGMMSGGGGMTYGGGGATMPPPGGTTLPPPGGMMPPPGGMMPPPGGMMPGGGA